MKRHIIIYSFLAALSGCEGPHYLVYNMTECPITVVYSVANIHNQAVTLPPGEAAGGFGMGNPELQNLEVIDRNKNSDNKYSTEVLAALRDGSWHIDQWGYFDDGLRLLSSKPDQSEVQRLVSKGCSRRTP
jgi:hypothetical protein